jgi:L-alanine-DL-glutamate epimerase-like enolase superfamily enzyme
MTAATVSSSVAVESLSVSAYELPTDGPESDGTFEWGSTTIVIVEAAGGGQSGLGYTYTDASAGQLIEAKLVEAVRGADAMSPPAAWAGMQAAVRNVGRPGLASMAIAAVDIALWDLKARLLAVPLADALPRFHERVPVYGSGGFTSYSNERLGEQLASWAEVGIPRVKMKVGREPSADVERVRVAQKAVGDDVELMVDANGAHGRKQALAWSERFAALGVSYFEEPVSSDDLEGLRLLRDRSPSGIAIAAGEYGWDLAYFRAMLEAGAVDVLQADVTRCGGITEFVRIDGLCKAHQVQFSAHCAPAVSAHACCAMETLAHLEYFHDHVRLERILFDGSVTPSDGYLRPDRSRPGLGLELKRSDAAAYEV